MKKIIVIGCPGSGKSYFSRALRDALNLPLHHLDNIYHRPDKTTLPREEFDSALSKLLAKDEWIIDGNYKRTLKTRIEACDTVFLFDLPVEECLRGVTERIGKPRDDMPWVETELDAEFKKFIEEFPTATLPYVCELLSGVSGKEVTVFKSREESESFIKRLKQNFQE